MRIRDGVKLAVHAKGWRGDKMARDSYGFLRFMRDVTGESTKSGEYQTTADVNWMRRV